MANDHIVLLSVLPNCNMKLVFRKFSYKDSFLAMNHLQKIAWKIIISNKNYVQSYWKGKNFLNFFLSSSLYNYIWLGLRSGCIVNERLIEMVV